MTKGYIHGINGPVVKVRGSREFMMHEMVKVGGEKLIGEVIGIDPQDTIVEVYENTTGLKAGEEVVSTGRPLSAALGPGIIGNIFDGIQRPLTKIALMSGDYISRGLEVDSIDMEKKWDVTVTAKVGDKVMGGDVLATCPETGSVLHKIMVPPETEGEIVYTADSGQYTCRDVIAKIRTTKGEEDITLVQYWPVRRPRPCKKRLEPSIPLVTGQRIIDTLFPIAKGGTAAIPGGFGTGKTMTQHQLAKWSDADIIVYIGCGERGNEMTQVLEEFSELIDPRTKKSLLERTVLIANTSNMPVAAREASIYSGITLAEYYRDMGYHVAIMADSTSRWAEALREISGRLEEMPAEEGFPAYLSSRLSQFYERAALVENQNGTTGSVTIIGAVSPQGGDFSEPVTQNTKRFIRAFWALDRSLAYSRHYPAIQWLTSYSEYMEDLTPWYKEHAGKNFISRRKELMRLLNEESKLMEIVKLIGSDVLPDGQKLILEVCRVIRVGYLQQNAYHDIDTYVPIQKQDRMMEIMLYLYDRCKALTDMGLPMSVLKREDIFEKIVGMKFEVENDRLDKFDEYKKAIDEFYDKVYAEQA
ncbi:MAG: V-type ATP synthase subunit A [Clostridia bacterium]